MEESMYYIRDGGNTTYSDRYAYITDLDAASLAQDIDEGHLPLLETLDLAYYLSSAKGRLALLRSLVSGLNQEAVQTTEGSGSPLLKAFNPGHVCFPSSDKQQMIFMDDLTRISKCLEHRRYAREYPPLSRLTISSSQSWHRMGVLFNHFLPGILPI